MSHSPLMRVQSVSTRISYILKMQAEHIEYAWMCSRSETVIFQHVFCCLYAWSESLHTCGSCVSKTEYLTFVESTWHSIQRTETRGVKRFPPKPVEM